MISSRIFSSFAKAVGVSLSFLLLVHCTPTQSTSQPERYARKAKVERKDPSVISPQDEKLSNLSLADMLRRVPGVVVRGDGINANVAVRGISSFNLSNEPLFVVDGVPTGNSYANLAVTLNPNDIKHIRLLTGADATLYGVRGANGVVMITQKN